MTVLTEDRELLELAAKAAGIDGWFVEPHENNANLWWGIDSETKNRWNPLTDDGDALRLAVKLGMMLKVVSGYVVATVNGESCYDQLNPDPYAATRRAIVRAAAEIGKGMK